MNSVKFTKQTVNAIVSVCDKLQLNKNQSKLISLMVFAIKVHKIDKGNTQSNYLMKLVKKEIGVLELFTHLR